MTIKDHPHPGLILSRFLARRYITVGDLCTQMDIQSSHIESVLHGRRRIGALFAHRLCQAIGGKPQIWMRLQKRYDTARQNPLP